jgi:hypothetical protein
MYNATERYDQKYVEMIEAKKWRAPAITKAAKVIYDYYRPRSVIDFGAANGFYVQVLQGLGCIVRGVEGTEHWREPMAKRIGAENVGIWDLREPGLFRKASSKFDLLLCIEVLEHLEEGWADKAVANLCGFSNLMLVTVSPHKGGFHHENPQSKWYWIRKFDPWNSLTYSRAVVYDGLLRT